MNNRFETTDSATYQLLLDKAREMRQNPTEAESVLWNYLSGDKLGAHFRRQHPVFGYIPDFVCLQKKLIIEIDGGYHMEDEQLGKDEERTNWLNRAGYIVLRFTNEEVLNDIDRVLEDISDTMEGINLNPQSNQAPLPSGGAGGGFRVGMGYDVHQLVEGRELCRLGRVLLLRPQPESQPQVFRQGPFVPQHLFG